MKILNDVEHRIFLAAMSREERICREVEKNHPDTNRVDLVKVCKRIVKKVNAAEPPARTLDERSMVDKLIEEINTIGSIGWLDISTEKMIDIIHKYTDKAD